MLSMKVGCIRILTTLSAVLSSLITPTFGGVSVLRPFTLISVSLNAPASGAIAMCPLVLFL